MLPFTAVVILAHPENCSYPFTYNGGLHYSCIENMTEVSSVQQPLACLKANATPIVCDEPGWSRLLKNTLFTVLERRPTSYNCPVKNTP